MQKESLGGPSLIPQVESLYMVKAVVYSMGQQKLNSTCYHGDLDGLLKTQSFNCALATSKYLISQ